MKDDNATCSSSLGDASLFELALGSSYRLNDPKPGGRNAVRLPAITHCLLSNPRVCPNSHVERNASDGN